MPSFDSRGLQTAEQHRSLRRLSQIGLATMMSILRVVTSTFLCFRMLYDSDCRQELQIIVDC